mgnify:CR=1 FL=1|jgi:hypothetical protein
MVRDPNPWIEFAGCSRPVEKVKDRPSLRAPCLREGDIFAICAGFDEDDY